MIDPMTTTRVRAPGGDGTSVRALMQTMRSGALLLDREGRAIASNASAPSLMRMTEAEILGKRIGILTEVRPASVLEEALGSAWSGSSASLVAHLRAKADDVELLVDLSLLQAEEDGEPIGILAQLTDLTDVRRRQQRDQEYHRRQMQSEKMQALEQFAAGVAHELNNPLASVVGFSELLLIDGDLTEDASDQVRAVIEQGRRAASIVQKLAAFANPNPPEQERLAVNGLVAGALELMDLELRTHHIRVDLSLAPDLPTLLGDRHQLVQSICAVVANGVTAMFEANGAGTLRIETSSPRPGWVRIRIRDDGPGIPRQVLPRIFDPFFTTRDVGRGPGIGLSMVYSSIKEHGGEVMAGNNEDVPGAQLDFELPVDLMEEEEDPPPRPTPRVLVADDDASMLSLVRRALETRGYDVTTASDGAAALQLMRNEEWDCIVLDLRMPKLTGQELYGRILEERPRMAARILFMTGDTAGSKAYEFLQAARVPHVYKPFSVRNVRAAIDQIVQSGR